MSISTPAQCHLWKKRDLTPGDINLNNLTILITFENESHLIRHLLRCNDCGQLYFYEFYEVVDWEAGNDAQYRTFIPVTSQDDGEKLSRVHPVELLKLIPRLQSDWPSDADAPKVKWIKEIKHNSSIKGST